MSIFEKVTDFFRERINTTLTVSVGAILVDISYNILQRRLRRAALVRHLESGERGRRAAESSNNNRNAADVEDDRPPIGGGDGDDIVHIDRCEEALRITRQFSHRGVISLVMQNVGTGVTSLLRNVSLRRRSTTYVSLASARTLEDLCAVLQREFRLETEERLPTSFFVLARLLRGMSGILGSDASGTGGDGSGSEDGGGDSDAAQTLKFEKLTDTLISAASDSVDAWMAKRKSKQQQQQQKQNQQQKQKQQSSVASRLSAFIAAPAPHSPRNRSKKTTSRSGGSSNDIQNPDENEDDSEDAMLDIECDSRTDGVPVIIFDDAADLDHSATIALAGFAHKCNLSGRLRVVIVVSHPYEFFNSKFSHSVKVISPNAPHETAVARYIAQRCPYLARETDNPIQSKVDGGSIPQLLVKRICGRNVGLASILCMRLEEILCDSEVPLTILSASEVVDSVFSLHMRQYAFATTRPLHLYCIEPVGEEELDEQRHAVFSIAIALLDKQFEHAAEAESSHQPPSQQQPQQQHQHNPEKEHSDNSPTGMFKAESSSASNNNLTLSFANNPHHVEGTPMVGSTTTSVNYLAQPSATASSGGDSERVDFNTIFKVCPLRVFLRLIEQRRMHLPFSVTFDTVRFRAPLYRESLVLKLGATPHCEQRQIAKEDLARLKASFAK